METVIRLRAAEYSHTLVHAIPKILDTDVTFYVGSSMNTKHKRHDNKR